MLRIAVVANDYASGLRFIQYRFQDYIHEFNTVKAIFTLKNGDEVYLCYGENNKYLSMMFDAYLTTDSYESLEDIIKRRCFRR